MATNTVSTLSSLNYSKTLFNNPKVNCILLISSSGIILQANRAFLLSFGYDETDLVGQNFSLLFRDEDRKRDLPARELSTVLDEGQSYDNNFLVNKDLSFTWVSGESLLITNDEKEKCILKIIQNIHTQKESEYSIRRLNNFNEIILRSMQDPVIVVNEDLKIVTANDAFAKIFNLGSDGISHLDFKSFIGSLDKNSDLSDIMTCALSSDDHISQSQLEIAEGDLGGKVFDVSCSKLDTRDAQRNVLLIFHDITALKQNEKQTEDILNYLAHELRNPLTNIILNMEFMGELLKENNISEFDPYIARGKASALRLKKLINDLNRTTNIISGTFELERSLFNLDQMIDESIHSTVQAYPHVNITKNGGGGIWVFGDKDKLIQVVTNFLGNAVKYSNGNSNIEILTKTDGDMAIVSVRDWGMGVPAHELAYIFNRFYRAKRARSIEGLGLGLYICRQIVVAHGGKTWVESQEGRGSTFSFSVPIDKT